ncbi:MAG: DUF1801 domain-containing protein [Ghiorsea sp.]
MDTQADRLGANFSSSVAQDHTLQVQDFMDHIEGEKKRVDCQLMLRMMERVTQQVPTMWGKNMVGFGRYHYQQKNGCDAEFFVTGFSPNQQCLTIYIMSGFDMYANLLRKVGKFRAGNGCLYIDRLEDVSLTALACLIHLSVDKMHQMYDCE